MKKNLLTISLLAVSLSSSAQVLLNVNPDAVFYVGENTLVYNGGGMQTKGNGVYDIRGNVMVVGGANDVVKTLNTAGTADKTDGGNIILRLNNPANHSAATNPSTYGQLYIQGSNQASITAIVDKEYRATKHGTYQQIALPFYNKPLSSLSTELAKTFTTGRWSQNEILKYDNRNVLSRHYSDLNTRTSDPTGYYMLGSLNLDLSTPPSGIVANFPVPKGLVYTLKGIPFANGINALLKDAGSGIDFGAGGTNRNVYGEKYNSYLQDTFDLAAGSWVNNYGKNLYQFGNPYFTNLDLSKIGYVESAAIGDNNQLLTIQGIRYDPGVVQTLSNGSTYATGALIQTFVTSGSSQGTPTGDVGLMIKPMQSFVVKLTSGTATDAQRTLNFDNLRRFKWQSRNDGTNYQVTANRGRSQSQTVKQLGVIGLDANGNELARTYYIVYPDAVSGHSTQANVQATISSPNFMMTFEEDKVNGGYDYNYTGAYALYINEANEIDFKGKAIPLALYSSEIKSLKFEVRENAELIEKDVHNLSTGVGFYYKALNGSIAEASQDMIIPVIGDEYSLYYGKPESVLGTNNNAKPSRTKVVYSTSLDKYVVRFDPDWKRSDINVYDMSGKLVLSQKNVQSDKDFIINLAKMNSGYLVTAVSEKGEKISQKIIR